MIKQSLIVATAIFSSAGIVPSGMPAQTGGTGSYKPVAEYLKVPADIKLGLVTAAATDAAGNLYMSHIGKNPILVFDKEGKFLRSFGDDLFKGAHGLRVDRDGNLWVIDFTNHTVVKLDSQGKVLMTLGTKDKKGTGDDQFNQPADVAVGRTGEIYVADGYGNSRVMKFSKDGKFIKSWGKKGTGPGEFNLVHGICFDSKDRLYVADRTNKRIQVFDTEGKFLDQWKTAGAPHGVFATQDKLFMVDAQKVQIFDLTGKVLETWGDNGKKPGQLGGPHWIWVDSQGALFIAEASNRRVQKFVTK